MGSLTIYDPRVDKLKRELISQIESNRTTLKEINKVLTAGHLMYKAVKRGKSAR